MSDDKRQVIAAVLLVVLAVSVRGLLNGFAHDDVLIILGDPRIHEATGLRGIFESAYWPPPFRQDLYRPLTTLALAAEYALGRGSPLFFRCVSYAFYTVASIAVFQLALRFVSRQVAAGTAILFAAHPVHVEAVALGVNQNELLIGTLACTMAVLYIDRRRFGMMRWQDWGLLSVMYAVAILLKETGFVLVAILVPCEMFGVGETSVRKRLSATWRGYSFLAVVALAGLVVRYLVLDSVVGTFTAEALSHASRVDRLLTVLQVVPQWVRLLSWPAHLRADYSPNEFTASTGMGWTEALGILCIVSIGIVAWRSRRAAPAVPFGILWAAIALLPVSNVAVVTGVLIAERTLFLPSVGWLIALGGLLQSWLPSAERQSPPLVHRIIVGVVTVLVIAGVIRSAERQSIWRNDGVLWLTSARDAPRSFRVQYALGDVLFDIGRPQEGMQAYQKAIAAAPEPWILRNDLARRLRGIGDDESALGQLQESLLIHPDQPDATAEAIVALIALGQYDKAQVLAQNAATRWPTAPVFMGLGHVVDSALAVHAPAGAIRLRIRTSADAVRARMR